MSWFKNIFRRDPPPPPPPVLLRLTEPCGRRVEAVDVSATFYPSGKGVSRRHMTAEGLCVIPWRGMEDRVEVEIRSRSGLGSVSIRRDRYDRGRVQDLRLVEP